MAGPAHRLSVDIEMMATLMFAQIFLVYLESAPAIQQIVRDMVGVVNDPEVEPDDHARALDTIREALFRTGSGEDVAKPEEGTPLIYFDLAVTAEFAAMLDELAKAINGTRADVVLKGVALLKAATDAKRAAADSEAGPKTDS